MMNVLVDSRLSPVKSLVLGSTLIEVLVALVVLGIGVIGFSATQLRSVALVNEAYYRTQAILIAQDVIERIKANPRGWPDHYASQEWQGSDIVVMQPCIVSSMPVDLASGCDQVNEIVEFDHFELSQQLRVSLPKATISIHGSCAGGVSCVDVMWGETGTGTDCSVVLLGIEDVMDHHCVSVNFIAYRQQ
jgi:type IV pilus assembly protein PilV